MSKVLTALFWVTIALSIIAGVGALAGPSYIRGLVSVITLMACALVVMRLAGDFEDLEAQREALKSKRTTKRRARRSKAQDT